MGDVASVAVAQVREDIVVDFVKSSGQFLELLFGEARERTLASPSLRPPRSLSVRYRAISIAPSGALTHVLIISPELPNTLPVRRSRTCPERS